MRTRLYKAWTDLRASLWFLPFLMAILAVGLAIGLIWVDIQSQTGRWDGLPAIYVTGPAGARELLSTVASSAITVAGVVFSITIVALSLTTSQYGPRILPRFMQDRTTQLVLGTFIAVFLYALLVLSRVWETRTFVPQYAVAGAIMLGALGFGALIYFIHHVALFIQATRIVESVAKELTHTFERLFPERIGEPEGDAEDPEAQRLRRRFAERSRPVLSSRSGYVQMIDPDRIMRVATEHDLIIRVLLRPGEFAAQDAPIARVMPEGVDDEVLRRIDEVFLIGPARTPVQDAEFAIVQLAQIALRALSPAVNDPFTAISCVDRLSAGLIFLAEREIPSALRRDREGRIRIVAEPYTYRGLVDAAFDPIRRAASGNVAVTTRLLTTIERIARRGLPDSFREALRDQAVAIRNGSREDVAVARDREDTERRFDATLRAVAASAMNN